MLRDLQTYIASRGTVSITDLGLHFQSTSDTLRPMLARLRQKGRIRPLMNAQKCAGCTCCDQENLELYEWVARSECQSRPPHNVPPQPDT